MFFASSSRRKYCFLPGALPRFFKASVQHFRRYPRGLPLTSQISIYIYVCICYIIKLWREPGFTSLFLTGSFFHRFWQVFLTACSARWELINFGRHIHFTLMVCLIRGKWPYSCCFKICSKPHTASISWPHVNFFQAPWYSLTVALTRQQLEWIPVLFYHRDWISMWSITSQ